MKPNIKKCSELYQVLQFEKLYYGSFPYILMSSFKVWVDSVN